MGFKINYDGYSTPIGSPYVIATGKNISFQKLYDYMCNTGDMDLYAVLIDATKDEREELTEVDVYYLSDLIDLIGEYCGYDNVIRMLEKAKEKRR